MALAGMLALISLVGLPLVYAQDVDSLAIAQAVIDNMINGDYEAATTNFNAEMAAALSADQLEQTWFLLEDQVGPFQQQVSVTQQVIDDSTVVVITLQFEAMLLDAQLSITADGEINGFYIRPSTTTPPSTYEAPSYVDQVAFAEHDLTLNAGTEWELPAMLSLPVGEGPFPAVILVQGSGQQDRDETIGPNKPFRDLAWGLASQGIAVLRYDKRTFVHAQAMAAQIFDLGIEDETINDAVAAVSLLKTQESIDPDRIVILGHSLGGNLGPWIATQTPDLAGLIILEGNARSQAEVMLDQVNYQLELYGAELSASDQAQFDALLAEIRALQQLDESTDPATTYLGMPAAYWLDLQQYDPVATAQALDLPILIVQGERDYQVTMTDFGLWQAGLEDKQNVTFASYADLDHLLMSGTGPSKPADYEQPNHVSEDVIIDLANWILNL